MQNEMNRGNEIGYLVLTRVEKWTIVVLNRQGRDLKASAEYLCQNIPSVTPRGYKIPMRFSLEVISLSFHIQFGCLSIQAENFRAAFTTKGKSDVNKPSSLDLRVMHICVNDLNMDFGQTSLRSDACYLELKSWCQKILTQPWVPKVFSRVQRRCFEVGRRPYEKSLTPKPVLIRTRSRNLESVSEVLFCGFLSVSEARSERFAAKVSDLKARIPAESLCSIGHSFFVRANDLLKRTQI